MFKIKKIYNSSTSAPEPCRMPTTSSVEYRIGTALTLTSGKLTNAAATDKPLYIAGESAAAGAKKYLICYPVFDNMVFEVPVVGSPLTAKCGTRVTLAITDGFADGVSATTTDGVATLVDLRGATMSGDSVYVRFEN